jgi:hypothetical protein
MMADIVGQHHLKMMFLLVLCCIVKDTSSANVKPNIVIIVAGMWCLFNKILHFIRSVRLFKAVTHKASICRRYLSLASWWEPRWNPCHSLIFDY